jgi:hypothetical protein
LVFAISGPLTTALSYWLYIANPNWFMSRGALWTQLGMIAFSFVINTLVFIGFIRTLRAFARSQPSTA